MMKADIEKIKKLLETVSAYRISIETGIGDTTISRWVTGKTPIEKMSFEHAAKLTEFMKKLEAEAQVIKPLKITDVYGRDLIIDEASQRLTNFNNKNKKIVYNAKIIENGVYTRFATDYVVEGTVDDIEEKLNTPFNPIKVRYAAEVDYSSTKNDPDGKIWERYVQHVKENEDEYFTEEGDWK